ncbi:LytR/AlgR family response regulator transcription factor [Tenacibaculum sp. Ill]|uniref:LytR/AlgR family response regulator transcription factor n=1 Tax=Tenacibaculum sp. Ill TaxID=3445935 RepID=UPI003F796809
MKCIIVDDEPLAHIVIKNYSENLDVLDIVKVCHSALDAMNYLNKHSVDLIFLDINMPKLKGLDFLRTLHNPPLIIITTAYQEHALEGYELNILDYLLKPFSFERFLKAVNKATAQKKLIEEAKKPTIIQDVNTSSVSNTNTTVGEQIFIKGDKKIHQVTLDSINYLESIGSYVKVHLENETIITLDRLGNFEKLLPNTFIRVHKSYIIPTKKIEVIEGNRIKIQETYIPIGRAYKHNLTKLIK